MDGGGLLERLPAREIREVLEALLEARRRRAAGDNVFVPRITLVLRNGRELTGYVLSLGEEKWADCLVFDRAPAGEEGGREAVYLPLSGIAALVVHEAAQAAETIGFGKVTAADRPAPTRLAVERAAQELARQLSDSIGRAVIVEVDWNSDDAKETVFRSLGQLVETGSSVLREIARDRLGLESLKSRIDRVRFLAAAGEPVQWDGKVLALRAGAKPASRGDLKSALESAL